MGILHEVGDMAMTWVVLRETNTVLLTTHFVNLTGDVSANCKICSIHTSTTLLLEQSPS
jgi:hypothetical protein